MPGISLATCTSLRNVGCVLLFLSTWPSLCCWAQEAPAITQTPVVPAAGQLTLETAQRRFKEVDVLPNLDDAAREELRGIYQEAIRDLTAADEFRQRANVFAEMAGTAAEKLQQAQFQKSVAGAAVTIDGDIPRDATLAKLEELRKVEEEKLAEAKRRAEQLKAEPGRRQARRAEMAGKVEALRASRGQYAAELGKISDVTAAKNAALATRLQAKILAADAELKLYEQEVAAYNATTSELLPLEIELAERNVSVVSRRVSLWQAEVKDHSKRDVDQDLEAAQLQAERATAAARPLALRNLELAEESVKLVTQKEGVERDLQQSQDLLEQIQEQFKVTREKVDSVGLNYAIGLLLRKEDSSLPDVSQYRRNSRRREETIRDVQLRIIDLRVDRSTLNDVGYVESFIADAGSLPEAITPAELEQEVTSLVEQQREMLTKLWQRENAYFERLVDLESTERQLCAAVAEYENYIDERVLWIRSSELLAWSDLLRSQTVIRSLADRTMWEEAWATISQDIKQRYLIILVALLAWLVLLAAQRRLRTAITRQGERAASGSCRSFMPTALSLLWTTLITALWPALMLLLAWRLSTSADRFSLASSAGLTTAGVYFVTLEFLRQVCRSKGLAESHFAWPAGMRLTLRKNLRWLVTISVPLVFIAAMLYADAGSHFQDAVGTRESLESSARLFVLGTLASALLFVHRTLRPGGLLCRSLADGGTDVRSSRMRIVYGIVFLIVGTLLMLAFVGYDYTVWRLVQKLYKSVLLVEILLVVTALVSRSLVIVRRRMAIALAQQRRAQLTGQGEISATLASIAVVESTPDLAAMDQQSRRLLHSLVVLVGLGGLWYIWIDVIPALNFLERFDLWTVTSGTTQTVITVNHVIVAGVIVAATVLAARNIPGLLEIVVLSRLPLDAGNRYAIITISRYLLTILGVILAFGAIGISWSSYQWLVAAVSVGLGFGLQEIFANFVSGLIVLFEQPIRVGDVVTIGEVTGVVSKIRMRATTVTNWDRKEFIVPNREFITGKLLNWTLSNTVNRVVITVGVAYGTDPDVVQRTLMEIARDHPLVLDDPAPNVTFDQFGDSTLNIVLRCYLPDLEHRLATVHELNTAAQRRLNELGIEFAFPTRELYIRSAAGDGELGRESAGRENGRGAGPVKLEKQLD